MTQGNYLFFSRIHFIFMSHIYYISYLAAGVGIS